MHVGSMKATRSVKCVARVASLDQQRGPFASQAVFTGLGDNLPPQGLLASVLSKQGHRNRYSPPMTNKEAFLLKFNILQ